MFLQSSRQLIIVPKYTLEEVKNLRHNSITCTIILLHVHMYTILYYNVIILEYRCNKYCNLIGHIEASNQLRNL